MTETTQNLKPVPCQFCGYTVVFANCNKLAFPIGDYMSFIEFKKAKFIEVTCGKCREKTVVRNPKTQFYK